MTGDLRLPMPRVCLHLGPHLALAVLVVTLGGCEVRGQTSSTQTAPVRLKIATFNVGDVRTQELRDPGNTRLSAIAEIVRKIGPDILLLNEIAYEEPGPGDIGGRNGRLLAQTFLNTDSMTYVAYMPPTNTGIASGFDLDRNGIVADSTGDRSYGNDAWGFGTFPGQYAMVLLVSDRFRIAADSIRTFQHFRWSSMPEALRPVDPATDGPWYDDKIWEMMPLSSKNHVDVPVDIGGRVIHVLASHPTPPAFDGPENRNKTRNHDEIRFWAEFLDDASFLVDDDGRSGGLERGKDFVILGDLNSDPDEGDSIDDPVGRYLMSHPRVNGAFVPESDDQVDGLDADDTARWGLRVDYVLPSTGLRVLDGGIVRTEDGPSDHFLVWLEVEA